MVKLMPEDRLLESPLLFKEAGPSVLFRPSTDRVRPTHILEGNLLPSKCIHLNVNHIQEHCPNCQMKLTITSTSLINSTLILSPSTINKGNNRITFLLTEHNYTAYNRKHNDPLFPQDRMQGLMDIQSSP